MVQVVQYTISQLKIISIGNQRLTMGPNWCLPYRIENKEGIYFFKQKSTYGRQKEAEEQWKLNRRSVVSHTPLWGNSYSNGGATELFLGPTRYTNTYDGRLK